MEFRSGMYPRQAALARASQLTIELIELVRRVRAELVEAQEPPAHEARPGSARLQAGDLRSAVSAASRRATRPVPHLLG